MHPASISDWYCSAKQQPSVEVVFKTNTCLIVFSFVGQVSERLWHSKCFKDPKHDPLKGIVQVFRCGVVHMRYLNLVSVSPVSRWPSAHPRCGEAARSTDGEAGRCTAKREWQQDVFKPRKRRHTHYTCIISCLCLCIGIHRTFLKFCLATLYSLVWLTN